jgi:cytochrome c oxidase cbb3-type subunit 3
LVVASLVAGGCDFSSSEVRDWEPTDHDKALGRDGQVAPRAQGSATAGPDPSLVELAWQRNCTSCHGVRGRGDGPQGPMVRAPDLTRADWQGQVTDAQLLEVIRKGRNRMPAFEALPEQVVIGLVARIRASRAAP